jgi:ribosome-binding protein aMBF1 (putative translation factor)
MSPTKKSTAKLHPDVVTTARRLRKMSQAELGFAIRKSQPFVSDFERGLVGLSPRDEKIIRRILGLGQ